MACTSIYYQSWYILDNEGSSVIFSLSTSKSYPQTYPLNWWVLDLAQWGQNPRHRGQDLSQAGEISRSHLSGVALDAPWKRDGMEMSTFKSH